MKAKLEQVQPGALVERRMARFGDMLLLDVITDVIYKQPGKVDQIIFRSGDVWTISRHTELEFIGNFRHDRGEIELGPQVEYGEPRKVQSYTKEELTRLVSPSAPEEEPEEESDESSSDPVSG